MIAEYILAEWIFKRAARYTKSALVIKVYNVDEKISTMEIDEGTRLAWLDYIQHVQVDDMRASYMQQ